MQDIPRSIDGSESHAEFPKLARQPVAFARIVDRRNVKMRSRPGSPRPDPQLYV
jgi:hypothetical protein